MAIGDTIKCACGNTGCYMTVRLVVPESIVQWGMELYVTGPEYTLHPRMGAKELRALMGQCLEALELLEQQQQYISDEDVSEGVE